MRNSIIVKGDGEQYEGAAAAAVTPGHLVEETSSGTIQKQATAAEVVQKMFAIENYLEGQDVDDDYATGDQVLHRAFKPGDEVYAILADNQTVVIGDRLESAGGGELRKQAESSAGSIVAPEALVAFAREAVDSNLTAACPVNSRRIVVRIA